MIISASSFYLYHYANKNVRKAKNPIQGVQKKEFFSNFANFCEIKISKFCLSFPELPKMRNDLASFYFDKYAQENIEKSKINNTGCSMKRFFFQIVQILVDLIFFQKWRLLALKKLKMSEPFFYLHNYAKENVMTAKNPVQGV